MERSKVGIVGGGQLGRMLTEAALPLGIEVTVIDPGENCPAAQAGAEQIQASLTDSEAVHELASRVDVVTWEIEHIDAETLKDVAVPVEPSPKTLRIIQDKLTQKLMLEEAGIPIADFMNLPSGSLDTSISHALALFDKIIVKTRTGGYDGRGNKVISSEDSCEQLADFKGVPLYAEKVVPFQKELAVIIARDTRGNIAQYPVVETVHVDNICHLVLAPALIGKRFHAAAEDIAHETAKLLEGAGVFAIEMFLTEDGQIMVNEIAPRVHNSGHHTIEGNKTSQFEQHIRAVSGLPLGSTDMLSPAVAMVNILGERNGEVSLRGVEGVLAQPDTHLHLYGKSPTKVARKMGHITVRASSVDEARRVALKARKELTI